MFDKFILIILYVLVIVINGQFIVCNAQEQPAEATMPEVQKKVVPDHEIKYEESLSPDWKINWDLARSLYREKKYPEAVVQYEILFTQKENIVEARWEYVSILMYLGRWENARAELEKLLTAEPESIRYRIAMAKVSMETGNSEYGVALYSQLLKESLPDTEKIEVLKGLIQAYEREGQKENIPMLLGQLISLVPDNFTLHIQLASCELELGEIDKAKDICSKLEQSVPQDVAVLSLQAHIEERLNNQENEATYWQKVIALAPDHAEAHLNLYSYYFANENWAMSFKHLEQLIRMTPNDVDLLKKAADLNIRLDRIDRALEYYEFALSVNPLNKDIIEGKKKAQKILAQDLLVLVENDEERKLWQDLVKVAPDSVGVYREIANLLRDQGKVSELINVLKLLNKHQPSDQRIYDELSSLLKQQGMEDELTALESNRADEYKTNNK